MPTTSTTAANDNSHVLMFGLDHQSRTAYVWRGQAGHRELSTSNSREAFELLNKAYEAVALDHAKNVKPGTPVEPKQVRVCQGTPFSVVLVYPKSRKLRLDVKDSNGDMKRKTGLIANEKQMAILLTVWKEPGFVYEPQP